MGQLFPWRFRLLQQFLQSDTADQFTAPSGGGEAVRGVALRIPYYLVARPQANVSTTLGAFSAGTATATATNKNAAVAGSADFYAWGLSAAQTGGQTNQTADVRAVGVQSFALDAARQLIVFAVNTYNRWSSASSNEFDIYVDTNGDGNPDYVVIGVDFGAVTTGSFDGRMGAFVLDLATGVINVDFLATAPSDGSTAELPVLASRLGLSAAHPRFSYQAVSFDLLNGGAKAVPGVAKYNAWSSSISQGDFLVLPPGGSATSTVSVNAAEAAQTAALGIMVVTTDNKSGAGEAQLIPVR